MVQLALEDIKTRDVLDWKGVHIFHAPMSSCSQKLRIFLNLKGIDWESHLVDLGAKENIGARYLGINPRGLVPTLVHDGAVHIESNDILTYLDRTFPEPRLIPAGMEDRMEELLAHEDDLHLDLRAISFRFIFAPPGPPKSPEDLKSYATLGSGSVGGRKDPEIDHQIAFWERYAAEGITDDAARRSAGRFRDALDELDRGLADHRYLLGDSVTVLDVAWFVYANRLALAGYPIARLHPRVGAWFEELQARSEFAREVATPPELAEKFAATRRRQDEAGVSLEKVAGL